jgi:hypothetical protein
LDRTRLSDFFDKATEPVRAMTMQLVLASKSFLFRGAEDLRACWSCDSAGHKSYFDQTATVVAMVVAIF